MGVVTLILSAYHLPTLLPS